MERLNAKLLEKYKHLKKRKIVEELDPKLESYINEYHSASADYINEVQEENKKLFSQLSALHQQFSEQDKQCQEANLKIKELSNEVMQLRNLLSQRNEGKESSSRTPPREVREEQAEPCSSKRKPKSSTANTAADPHCCLQDASNNSRHACIYQALVESLVGMKVSVEDKVEGTSLSVIHELTGYSFSLTYELGEEREGELTYSASSLGTLEGIAPDWMKQEIVFSSAMCPVFFRRISRLIGGP